MTELIPFQLNPHVPAGTDLSFLLGTAPRFDTGL